MSDCAQACASALRLDSSLMVLNILASKPFERSTPSQCRPAQV